MTELEKSQAKTIELQREQIELQREEIRLLKEKIDYILRQLHGSKSEKSDIAQLELLLDPDALKKPVAADCEEAEQAAENIVPINGGTTQGYFWIYRSATAGVLYDWHASRAHTCLNNILTSKAGNFSGILQCDGYSAYETWAAKHKGVTLAGCWVHARRKFKDAEPHSKDADIILNYIRRLYHAEHRFQQWIAKSHHPPEAIIYYRRRYHKKLLKELRAKLHQLQTKHLPKSSMSKAISYAINQWHKLCLAIKHSPTLDNNAAENAVRPLKLGAKNWLFIGREDTGWRSAIIYTLVENCRILGHDPYAYLKWVFEKIPGMTNQDDMRALLPVNWGRQLEQIRPNEAAA